MEKVRTWLQENGYDLFNHRGDLYGVFRGAGSGSVLVKAPKPSHLGRGPYILRVAEDAVYQMHILDDGVSGLAYQSWICVENQSYETQDQLKEILDKLTTPKETCWSNGE